MTYWKEYSFKPSLNSLQLNAFIRARAQDNKKMMEILKDNIKIFFNLLFNTRHTEIE